MDIGALIDSVQGLVKNWDEIVVAVFVVLAAIGGVLKAVESLLQLFAPFTPWKWDDNLASLLGKWAANKIFHKGK